MHGAASSAAAPTAPTLGFTCLGDLVETPVPPRAGWPSVARGCTAADAPCVLLHICHMAAGEDNASAVAALAHGRRQHRCPWPPCAGQVYRSCREQQAMSRGDVNGFLLPSAATQGGREQSIKQVPTKHPRRVLLIACDV